MSTKAPIYLKRGSRKGKREKLRDILSSDMISPPLGDFRHTIHIGSGGENDMFGDISFLQGKFDLLPRMQGSHLSQRSSQIEMPFQFSHTTTVAGHAQANMNSQSPLLKNAISLPIIGGPQAVILPNTQAPPPKPPRLHLEDKTPISPTFLPDHNDTSGCKAAGEALPLSNNWTIQRAPNSPSSLKPGSVPQNGFPMEKAGNEAFLSQAGSLLSLHVDLGPSILDDVLQIMDKHQGDSVHLQDPGRREIHT